MSLLSHNKVDLNIKLSSVLFPALFLGYVIYSFLLYFQVIPAFLGGFFGGCALLVFLLFLPTSLTTLKLSIKSSKLFTLMIVSAYLICIFYTALYFLFSNNNIAVMQSFEIIIFWSALFPLGFYFCLSPKEKSLKVSIISSILIFIYVLFYFAQTGSYMLPFGTSALEDENISGYQGIARSILILGFLVFTFSKSNLFKTFSFLYFSIILFSLGSRSEFFCFLICVFIYQILSSFNDRKNLYILAIVTTLLTFLFYSFYDLISNSRLFRVLEISQDSSWNARLNLQEYGINSIKNNFILGDFGSHTMATGIPNRGTYIHNILSTYVNYGLINFILFSIIIYSSCIFSLLKIIKYPKDSNWTFCFLISTSVAILVTIAKPVFWPIIYLSWGIFLGTVYNHKYSKL